MEMRKVYATLRALLDVLEILVGPSPADRLGRQVLEEVIHSRAPNCLLFLYFFIDNCLDIYSLCNVYFIKSCSTFILII